jgi:carboxymethylenebutenolidase
MCDEDTVKDADLYFSKKGITRREFSKYTVGTAAAIMLPPVVNALSISEQDVIVQTPDGEADCYFVHPASGQHAAVIMWPDILGIRPAFRAMGKRLAESGYSVLVVNPYYRTARGSIVEAGQTFRDPGVRELLMPHARSLSPETCVTDGRALVSWLDEQTAVDSKRKIGTSGYCMTGSYTMRLAAAIPQRIGAGASFHGGGLVSEQPDSPHLLIDKIRAGFLIAIAESDDERDPEAKTKLREDFDAASLDAEIEVYAGAQHGWCPPDSPVYNEALAERAWERLLVLFKRELA